MFNVRQVPISQNIVELCFLVYFYTILSSLFHKKVQVLDLIYFLKYINRGQVKLFRWFDIKH